MSDIEEPSQLERAAAAAAEAVAVAGASVGNSAVVGAGLLAEAAALVSYPVKEMACAVSSKADLYFNPFKSRRPRYTGPATGFRYDWD
mmetsp:Transcript_80149/g.214131  ORF Transcript_80149/g.214131 Transcript_80149/m.214131 type:complete len:88 (-) Transcript_80149:53-316(-)